MRKPSRLKRLRKNVVSGWKRLSVRKSSRLKRKGYKFKFSFFHCFCSIEIRCRNRFITNQRTRKEKVNLYSNTNHAFMSMQKLQNDSNHINMKVLSLCTPTWSNKYKSQMSVLVKEWLWFNFFLTIIWLENLFSFRCYGLKQNLLKGCILAHCMGLGKTIQTLSFLQAVLCADSLKWCNSALVLCPMNTLHNWLRELSEWLDYLGRKELKE